MPKYEEWQAPWERASEPLDPERAKRFFYDFFVEKDNHKKRRDSLIEERDEALKENADLSATLERYKGKASAETGVTEPSGSTKQQDDSESEGSVDTSALARENALLKVRLETGLTERQAARLVGDDYDALAADAKAYMEEHGIARSEDSEDDGDKDGDKDTETQPSEPKPDLRRAPRRAGSKTGVGDDRSTEPTPKPSDLMDYV